MFSKPEDIELLFMSITGAGIFISFTLFIILFIFKYRQRQIIHEQEQERLKAEYEQGILNSRLEIQEQTLKQVAQELHDNMGQLTSMLNIQLSMVPDQIHPDVDRTIKFSKEIVQRLTTDLRELSVSLNNNYIQQMGLAKALETEAERVQKIGKMQVKYSIEGIPPDQHDDWQTVIFRICQEALNNAMKYSRAQNLFIRNVWNAGQVEILIKDDGIGFNPEEMKRAAGTRKSSGLTNIYERARLIKADVQISSAEGKGTEISIHHLF